MDLQKHFPVEWRSGWSCVDCSSQPELQTETTLSNSIVWFCSVAWASGFFNASWVIPVRDQNEGHSGCKHSACPGLLQQTMWQHRQASHLLRCPTEINLCGGWLRCWPRLALSRRRFWEQNQTTPTGSPGHTMLTKQLARLSWSCKHKMRHFHSVIWSYWHLNPSVEECIGVDPGKSCILSLQNEGRQGHNENREKRCKDAKFIVTHWPSENAGGN
jgi:hypothetical protein